MAARDTPAIRALRAAGVAFTVHEYAHDPRAESYALEAAAALGLDPAVVFKTLVVDLDGRLAVCLLPSGDQLDTRALGKRAALADAQRAERVTGYVTGGISPIGQRKRLPTLVDASALDHEQVYVSAGRRGLEIALAPQDLIEVTGAETRALRRAA
jgi:Cys-tRNA(Pro)/Cys-tRNA(Cys) deacylase